jgi:hypothetical protein
MVVALHQPVRLSGLVVLEGMAGHAARLTSSGVHVMHGTQCAASVMLWILFAMRCTAATRSVLKGRSWCSLKCSNVQCCLLALV